jgi:hypothetical protein
MAEIMVLILFALLLALGITLGSKNKQIEKQKQEFAELVKANPDGVSVEDVIQKLQRQTEKADKFEAEVARLAPSEQKAKELEDIIRIIKADRNASPAEIVAEIKASAEAVTQLAQLQEQVKELPELIKQNQELEQRVAEKSDLDKTNETLRGQIAQLSKQIKETGKGNEFPSCWVTEDGKVESIFELTVKPDGVVIRDHYLKDTVRDKEMDPFPKLLGDITYDETLSKSEFESAIEPIYNWSVKQGCRFYVLRYTTVQNAPVSLLNAVDNRFYPDSRWQYQPEGDEE